MIEIANCFRCGLPWDIAEGDVCLRCSLSTDYKKLQAENEKLKSVLREFITTKECKQTWIEEMHATIEDILEEMKEGK